MDTVGRLSELPPQGKQNDDPVRAGPGGAPPLVSDVSQAAQLLSGGDRGTILAQLHAHYGNAFVQAVLDELERAVVGLPDQPQSALVKLDDLAAKQHADIDTKVGKGSAGPLLDDPVKQSTGTPPKLAGPGKKPPDRDALRAKITGAGTTEVGQLDTALHAQLGELDRAFAAEQVRLDGMAAAQQKRTAGETNENDTCLAGTEARQDHTNQAQIAGETRRDDRIVAHEKTKLHGVAESERGWHRMTRDEVVAEDVDHRKGAVTATHEATVPAVQAAYQSGHDHAAQAGTNTKQAAQAQITGGMQAGAMMFQGALSAEQLDTEGKKIVAVQNARTDAATAALTDEEGKQGGRIAAQSTVVTGEMKQHAATAHDRMEAERAAFNSKAGDTSNLSAASMQVELAAAKQRNEQLKAETAAKLAAVHDREKAKVEAEVERLLAELAATADKDLAKEKRAIEKSLTTLDATDRKASSEMHRDETTAAHEIESEDAAHAKAIRAAGAKARAAIASFVGDARKRILTANKGTDRHIADAAKAGREQIAHVGDEARKDTVAFSDARQNADVADAAKDLEAFDTHATAAQKQLADAGTTTGGKIDEQWVNDAVGAAKQGLDGKGKTGADVTSSMRALLGLPKELQGKAVDKLTDAELDNLLKTVPDANREELLELVKNTTDPGRKLKLWGVYHKAHAMHDAQNDGAGKDAEAQRRHAARMNAATTTAAEVDNEIKFLQDRAKGGTTITKTDVDDLIKRKDTEHAMEMKYNVNFTNEGVRADGSNIVWGDEELKQFDQTLNRMPDAHLAGNAGLKDIHRQDKVMWPGGGEIGGIAEADGTVRIPTQTAQGGMSGENRQDADAALSPKISRLEWVMTHELGHNVSNKYSKEYQAYIKANGWEAHLAGTSALTATEKATLDAARGNQWDARASVDKGGKTYEINQEDPTGYISFTLGAVPRSGESEPGDTGYADPWGYARTRDYESFAEHYDFAMHVPEKVYKDFVEKPHAATERARVKLASASDTDKPAAQKDLDTAAATEKARKESFDIMRDKVYGTQAEQLAAARRLEVAGVDKTKIDAFNLAAARVSTPDQIRVVEAKYK